MQDSRNGLIDIRVVMEGFFRAKEIPQIVHRQIPACRIARVDNVRVQTDDNVRANLFNLTHNQFAIRVGFGVSLTADMRQHNNEIRLLFRARDISL